MIPMSPRRLATVCCITAHCFIVTSGARGDDRSDIGRLVTSYRSAVSARTNPYASLRAEGQLRETFVRPGTRGIMRTHQMRYERDGRRRLMRRRSVDAKGELNGFGEEVFCIGEQCFHLQKPPKASGFLLRYFGSNPNGFSHITDEYDNKLIDFPYVLFLTPIGDLLASKSLRVIKAEHEVGKGEAVRFSFEYRPSARRNEFWSGWWCAEPSNDWAINQFEYRGSGKRESGEAIKLIVRGSAEYGASSQGMPILKSVHLAEVDTSEGIELKHDVEIDCERFELTAAPSSEFRLSTYGLASLEQSLGSGFRWSWLIFLGIASIAFAISLRLRLAARRVPA
jgi:hypothetical protein